jgi:hypothetical protein
MIAVRAETTKNRRGRVVPYSAPAGELYAAYLHERRDGGRLTRGPLFVSASRRNRGAPIPGPGGDRRTPPADVELLGVRGRCGAFAPVSGEWVSTLNVDDRCQTPIAQSHIRELVVGQKVCHLRHFLIDLLTLLLEIRLARGLDGDRDRLGLAQRARRAGAAGTRRRRGIDDCQLPRHRQRAGGRAACSAHTVRTKGDRLRRSPTRRAAPSAGRRTRLVRSTGPVSNVRRYSAL